MCILCSYGSDSEKQIESHVKEAEIETIPKTTKTADRLIGDWGIYVHIVDGVSLSCNACPSIVFTDSSIAILTLPSGDHESYTWNSSIAELNIEFAGSNNLEHYLANSKYEMSFEQTEKFTELTLSSSQTEQYILRK